MPVPLNYYYLHILLALMPSHLTVIKIYDLEWPWSCWPAALTDGPFGLRGLGAGTGSAAQGATKP